MDTKPITDTPDIVVNQEALKLTCNAKGRYQWEIRIFPSPQDLGNDTAFLDRLEFMNNNMIKRFGSLNLD